MLSRQHYVEIAARIKRTLHPSERLAVAEELADYFQGDNPRFDRDRFLDACGVLGQLDKRTVAENRTLGREIHRKNPPGAKIGGYPDRRGDVISPQGKATGWFIDETVKAYRLGEPLSWIATAAYAVILRRRGQAHPGRRVAVAFSYGTGMILRGEEIDPELTDGEIRDAARGEAEYWLNVDAEDAERDQAEQARETGEDEEEE